MQQQTSPAMEPDTNSKLYMFLALVIGLGLTPRALGAKVAPGASPSTVRVTRETMKDVPFSKMRVTYQPEAPVYPPAARSQNLEGTVDLVVLVGKDGVPKSVEATAGPLVFRPSAIDFARHFRFEPQTTAVKDKTGKKTVFVRIEARTTFSVPFKLKAGDNK